ncbi:PREDICTED: topoisomerase I damage affected protein 7-like [Amphimedon queenslandica]|uniref:Uncharacterized protein n=1 Tax=Amphimedon queenslandica TaxID=400682 RepID=A0AAN0JPS4_AMPQE|nr:PREDICTED: topoisomerase I damage affected protein 7-like [Amphimedon queenslandica]|eukprot:XP_019858816.1 PREDICTED: topoisomerase I damage affected protein 7-like [Amphimedon queenslandica]
MLIGVDIRTVDDNVGRNLYPKFEAWSPANNFNEYTRVTLVEIRLTPDNFTTNGQYRFTLPTPLNVSSGYRIGVYQPPDDRSVVRFHFMNLSGGIDGIGKVKSSKIDDASIRIFGMANRDVDYKSWNILIHPIVQDTSCFSQFVPEDITNSLSYSITNSIFISDTRIFPDIKFTCHGIITNWILSSFITHYMPVIKIRRSNNLTTTALPVNISNAVSISQNLYNFAMSNEITVQPGDLLMIESNAANVMFYQHYNGPHNYRLGGNNELFALDANDYPLISVVVVTTACASSNYITVSTNPLISVVVEPTLVTTTDTSSNYITASTNPLISVVVEPTSVTTTDTSSNYITASTISSIATSDTTSLPPAMPPFFTNTATTTISSTHINTVITVLSSSSIYSIATATMELTKYIETNLILSNSLSLTIDTTSVMSTPVSTLQSSDSNIVIIAGSISTAVFILLVVTILVILIVSVLVCRRRWNKTSNGNDTFSSDERKAEINQQSDVPFMDKIQNTLTASTNPAYGVTGERCITDISANPAYGVTGKSGISANPAYCINTRIIGIINEESLVYDEPRTMYHDKRL